MDSLKHKGKPGASKSDPKSDQASAKGAPKYKTRLLEEYVDDVVGGFDAFGRWACPL